MFTFNLSGRNDQSHSMEVEFSHEGGFGARSGQGTSSRPLAPRMKTIIMYRCGHRYHKTCISEKLVEDQERARIIQDGASAAINQLDGIGVLDDDEVQPNSYLVAPQYERLAIYDRKRDRRRQTLSQRIKENQRKNLSNKQYNQCLTCNKYDISFISF